ncbi:MAG: hypothetical protein VXX85_03230 [Candidatus Margulisiibacteriota bacterium]|nr:hypothetical protein [Candidatus Margulisiibacteriota bacterium]
MTPGVNNVSSFPKSANIKQSDAKVTNHSKSSPPKNNHGDFYRKCDWIEGGFATPFDCNVYGKPWGTPSEK